MALFTITCASFIGLLLKNNQTNLARYIDTKANSANAIVETIQQQKSRQYGSRIKSLINYRTSPTRAHILKAFKNQNREELFRLTMPFLEVLRQENRHFSTFGWVLPDNHAFLRVHNPKNFGDDVSNMRPDIVAANQEKQQLSGFTAGYQGLQYRIVQPVEFNGDYLGTIQFGLADVMLLDAISAKLDIPVGMVMSNETFAFIKHSKIPHKRYGNYTIQTRDIGLFEDETNHVDWQRQQHRIILQGKHYVLIKVLDLNNFNREKQADIFVALDISPEINEHRTTLLYTIALSLTLLTLTFIVIFFSCDSLMVKDIKERNPL